MVNVIQNGGFESDLQGWKTSRTGDPLATVNVLIDTVEPYTGSKSLSLQVSGVTISGASAWLSQSLPASLFPLGASFQLSYAHKGFGDVSAELGFLFKGDVVKEFVNWGISRSTPWLYGDDLSVKGVVPDIAFDTIRLMFSAKGYVGADARLDLDEVILEVVAAPTPTYMLTIQVSGQGTTNPVAGSYTVNSGEVVAVSATPAVGWGFQNWDLNGVIYTQNPIPVEMITDAVLTANFVQIPLPPPPSVYPGPGDTKKYLALRWDWFGFRSYNRDVNVYMPILIEKLHPKVIQFRIGDFWYPGGDWPNWNPSFYAVAKQAVADMARICAQNNIVLMLALTNSENSNLGIGPDFYDPTVFTEGYVNTNGYVTPAGCKTYPEAIREFLEATEPYPPMWFTIDTEVTAPSPAEQADVNLLRQDVQALVAICAEYGTNFSIHQIYVGRGFEALSNELPWGLDTNYPYLWGASDGVDFIKSIDNRPYGFMMKIGILRNDMNLYWVEQSILNIMNTVDATAKCVLPFLDLTQEMIDPALCPDFVSVVTREAAARGWITSLTEIPPPATGTLSVQTTPISAPIYVKGVLVGTGTFTGTYTIGQVTVSFGDVAGYITPAPQVVNIVENQTTTVTGTYNLVAPPTPISPLAFLAIPIAIVLISGLAKPKKKGR